ncbi:MAG: hypothetical protein IMZ75_11995 [Actinobacteria bacterium]|nr:hypothetical protein [Actinomycetota bacterium]
MAFILAFVAVAFVVVAFILAFAVAFAAVAFAVVFTATTLVGAAFFAATPRLVAEVAFFTTMIGPFKVALRRPHERGHVA